MTKWFVLLLLGLLASRPGGGYRRPLTPEETCCRDPENLSANVYTVDRMEAGWSVLEDEQGHTFSIPASWLPAPMREGAVLRVAFRQAETLSLLCLVRDPEAEARRRSEAQQRRDRVLRAREEDRPP